jgi:hypothetical protein
MPGGSYSVPGSVGNTSSGGNTSSTESLPTETTASRSEDYSTSVATPSGMLPPPPQDIHEAPPDGGDDDDDDEHKEGSTSFDWGKTLGLIIIGALFLYGVTRP